FFLELWKLITCKLFCNCFGEFKGYNMFHYYSGSWHSTCIRSFNSSFKRLLCFNIYTLKRLKHKSRYWLHNSFNNNRHPCCHPAFKSTKTICRSMVSILFIPDYFIVHITAVHLCGLKANSEFNTFKGINTDNTPCNFTVQFAIIMHVCTYYNWNSLYETLSYNNLGSNIFFYLYLMLLPCVNF